MKNRVRKISPIATEKPFSSVESQRITDDPVNERYSKVQHACLATISTRPYRLHCFLAFLAGFLSCGSLVLLSIDLQGGQYVEGDLNDFHVDDVVAEARLMPASASEHKLAVVVPFRDRFDELMEFVPHISAFLRAKQIHFHVFVINQVCHQKLKHN